MKKQKIKFKTFVLSLYYNYIKNFIKNQQVILGKPKVQLQIPLPPLEG